jgi:hypothetical protein
LARVLALIPDLLFGSQVKGALAAAGHEVELTGDPEQGEMILAGVGGKLPPGVLVIDLDSDEFDGFYFVEARKAAGALAGTRTLGFYPHVNDHARALADKVGFDLVVPRSRMAREGPELISRVVGRAQ